MTKEVCYYCNKRWQIIVTLYGLPTVVHFCEERQSYVGWHHDNVQFDIPSDMMFQNQPGR